MTFTLDLTPLRRALTSLEDSLRVTEDVAWLQAQSDAVRNTLFAGVIQNFEFVYELATKMLKRQIEAEAATPGETDQLGFRDLLRVGARQATCRVSQAAIDRLSLRAIAARIISLRSGLRVTALMCDQSRVPPDQRRGLFSRARVYSSWRVARMARSRPSWRCAGVT